MPGISASRSGRIDNRAVRKVEFLKRFTLLAVRGYQVVVAPHLPPACRFFPTCSHYASQAVERHGAVHGIWLALKRIVRCNPLAKPGYDPVP